MSHFSAIGLVADDEDSFARMIDAVVDLAIDDAPAAPPARHLRWTDASGASLAIHFDAPDELSCVTPFFAAPTPARWRVRTSAAAPDPECAHCGGADCDIVDDAGELVTRATVQWLHFIPFRSWLASDTRDFALEVVAFAHQISFAATEEAFHAAQAEWFPASDASSSERPFRLAPQSFFPTGMFAEAGATMGERARALFAGRVESVVRATNTLTTRPFLQVRVATLPGSIDVVAPSAGGEALPAVGSFALVSGWLVGRPDVAAPATPSLRAI